MVANWYLLLTAQVGENGSHTLQGVVEAKMVNVEFFKDYDTGGPYFCFLGKQSEKEKKKTK